MDQKFDIMIRPPQNVANLRFPFFKKPEILGSFGLTTDGFYENTFNNLRYYNPHRTIKLPVNLSQAFQTTNKESDLKWLEYLDNIFSYIFEKRDQMIQIDDKGEAGIHANIVCLLEVLVLLFCTPYEHKENWSLLISKYRNTIYIAKQSINTEQNADKKTSDFWDRVVRRFCLQRANNPESSILAEDCPDFNYVFETIIENIRILYAAPISGIEMGGDISNEVNNCKIVYIKSRLKSMSSLQWHYFCTNVSMKWWFETYLIAVEQIILGLRTEKNFLDEFEFVNARGLRKSMSNYWNCTVGVNFLVNFLSKLQEALRNEENPLTVYEFNFNARESNITYKIYEDRTQYTFIPDWYILFLKENDNLKKK